MHQPLLPLYVDLDGTLVATDTLWESLVGVVKAQPLKALTIPFSLVGGRAAFKTSIADMVDLRAEYLPYDPVVLDHLRAEHARGRRIILATAAHERIAHAVAAHCGVFDGVLATSAGVNLKGAAKARAIREHAGGEYAYMGDSSADLAVWADAAEIYVAGTNSKLIAQASTHGTVAGTFMRTPVSPRDIAKQLRLHQWVKNILLFLPLFLAHRISEPLLFMQVAMAFLAFGLCASAVYVLNDVMDIESDRAHPTKRGRPMASGRIPLSFAVIAIPVLLLLATLVSLLATPPSFSWWLLTYAVLTTLYTFVFKRMAIIDVLVLAGLYTLRVEAGAAAASVVVSPWLLMFSMFLFTSLAFLKRYTELLDMAEKERARMAGRGYTVDDTEMIRVLGPAIGYISILVITLYVNSPEVRALYVHPLRLWLLVPCMVYWITRLWLIAHRGGMHEDPILFTVRDRGSYAVGLIVVAIVLSATLP